MTQFTATRQLLVCEVGRKTYLFLSIFAAILKLMVQITSIFG